MISETGYADAIEGACYLQRILDSDGKHIIDEARFHFAILFSITDDKESVS